MKLFATTVMAALFLVGLENGRGQGADSEVQRAVELLETTNPLVTPLVALGAVDPTEKKTAENLYDRQVEAISILAKAKLPATTKLLIPYLNYPSKDFSYAFIGAAPQAESVEVTRNHWPAFSALFEIPGSAEVLIGYASDKNNPINFRVACFHAVRYLNQNKFEALSKILNDEFRHSLNAENYLKSIEEGNLPFMGAFPVE